LTGSDVEDFFLLPKSLITQPPALPVSTDTCFSSFIVPPG
jgi:hypothetical protein